MKRKGDKIGDMGTNKKYKDSIFSLLFGTEEALRELYGALAGAKVSEKEKIKINTLKNVLFMEQINDLSFTIGDRLVVLIEHQSSINPNMPLRLLLYVARLYEKLLDRKKLYRTQAVKIPRAEFYVLYNGEAPYAEEETVKLSDLYLERGHGRPELELKVKVYNINEGHNEGILGKSATLRGYSIFIEKVRKEHKKGKELKQAMEAAIKWCCGHGILVKFLEENGSEVENMLLTGWNWDDAKEVWQEEARELGMQQGIRQGMQQGQRAREAEIVRNALKMGMTIQKVQELTGLSAARIRTLSRGEKAKA